MNYFLEYTVPAAPDDAEFEFPHNEIQSGNTIPLSETDSEIVHTAELLARTGWHPRVEVAAVRVCASITKVARDDTSCGSRSPLR